MKRIITAIVAVALASVSLFAQSQTRGCVRDEAGEPLAGVSVVTQVDGKTVGVMTDAEGNFSLEIQPGGGSTDIQQRRVRDCRTHCCRQNGCGSQGGQEAS